jgi:hypothetical protein
MSLKFVKVLTWQIIEIKLNGFELCLTSGLMFREYNLKFVGGAVSF